MKKKTCQKTFSLDMSLKKKFKCIEFSCEVVSTWAKKVVFLGTTHLFYDSFPAQDPQPPLHRPTSTYSLRHTREFNGSG